MNTIFVTGTDIGVGKTLVTALVALNLRALGHRVGVFKPFDTGCESDGEGLVSADALFLRETVGVKDSPDTINPLRLEAPLAPLIAARRKGISTQDWPYQADKALRALQKKYDFVVVEGLGGIAVPICEVDDEIWTIADFLQAWNMPTLVVARRTRGTINHTLLTARATPKLAGLVFNDPTPVVANDYAAESNPDFLAELGYFVCGCVPFLAKQDAATLQEVAASLQLSPVLQAMDEQDPVWQ